VRALTDIAGFQSVVDASAPALEAGLNNTSANVAYSGDTVSRTV
jgi:hypothetical protein